MSLPRRSQSFRASIVAVLFLMPLLSGVALTGHAAADTAGNPGTTMATTITQTNVAPNGPLTGLANLSNIHIVITAAAGTNNNVEIRLCKGGVNITGNSGFVPLQGGNCVLNPITVGSDAYQVVDPDVTLTTITTDFKVGVGTTNWATPGGPASVTCDSTNPCALWMKQAIGAGTYFTHYNLNFAGAGPVAPGAPTALSGVAGDTNVALQWTAPASNGGAAITSYTATAAPGGAFCTWTTGPLGCIVSGLTNAVPYTFTVTATNTAGAGNPSSSAGPYTPTAPLGSKFHPLSPVRILDSRGAVGGFGGQLSSAASKNLQLTDVATVPVTADAVILNVTVTGGTNNSFLTVFPTGTTVPNASNLNFAAGETIPNLVTVKLGTGGRVAFANAVGSVHVIADLVGYYDAGVGGDRYNPLPPARILDSRGAVGGFGGQLTSTASKNLQVTTVGGVPGSADAVVMNVTVTGGSANSFVTVFPTGTSVPNASNVNFAMGQTIPNLVTVKLGTVGQVAFANAVGDVHVIADVVGYFDASAGDYFHVLAPARILDSRGAVGGFGGPVSNVAKLLQVTGVGGVPVGADAVVGNTTVTGGTANSFLTVFPAGGSVPNASNVNFALGQTIPNLTAVKLSGSGQVAFANNVGSVHVIFDVVGYYAAT